MSKQRVILKPGKEKAIRNRHHWIFSGAVASMPAFSDGDCLPVQASSGEFIGYAYFNKKAKIIGRMVAFEDLSPEESLKNYLKKAFELRRAFFKDNATTAYRLVNGEGDALPGLIADRYGDTLVLQISTLGMEKFLPLLLKFFQEELSPKTIYEKSRLPSRKEEGLSEREGLLAGEPLNPTAEIFENGLRFLVDIAEGQKTGFFLDHREMRAQIRQLSQGKRVLNCFAYTGGFTVYAGAGGASRVDSVDISKSGMELAAKNVQINGLTQNYQFFTADVFQFLRERPLDYELVILDPPAFAKRQKDVVPACRGYKDINRLAIQKMPAKSLLLTSSCSYHVDAALFQTVVFQAAVEAKRNVRIIGRHQLAPDHPINIFHPETDYLKSLLLYID